MNKALFAATAALLPLALAAPAWAEQHEEEQAQPAPALIAPEIEFTEWTLDNGLRVIAIEDDSTATVTTSLWYEIGSKLDPEGRSGFAHLFEHILSRKTRNMPYNMIYDLTADVGGTRNASNGTDRTNYYETVPAQYLEAMLWTHRERMAFSVVDDDVFETERAVVKEEYRTRVLAPPYGLLSRVILPELGYDDLPHRRPGIGSLREDPVLQASSQTANETVPEVVEVMLNEFDRIGTEPLEDDLLDRRRLYLQGGYARSLESSSGFNAIVADLLRLGVDPAEFARYAENLETVDTAAASAAAAQYFGPANISVIVVGNAPAFIDELRALRPDVEVIPASELDLFDPQAPAMGG